MGVELTTAILETAALQLSYGSIQSCLNLEHCGRSCRGLKRVQGISPMTVMTMVRCRGLTSHSKWKTCCHVPKPKLPSLMGTVSDGPSSVACKCEWPFPSCQA